MTFSNLLFFSFSGELLQKELFIILSQYVVFGIIKFQVLFKSTSCSDTGLKDALNQPINMNMKNKCSVYCHYSLTLASPLIQISSSSSLASADLSSFISSPSSALGQTQERLPSVGQYFFATFSLCDLVVTTSRLLPF